MNTFLRLFLHEWRTELRQKHAIGGLVLYVLSAVYLSELAFKRMDGLVWLALFWLIVLFASVNAVARSFISISRGRMLYYYTLTGPLPFLLSKIAWNTLLLWFLALLSWGVMTLFHGQAIDNIPVFLAALLLGTLGMASSLSLVSAISARANNPFTLMAILGFPVLIPVLTLVVKISKAAVDGLDSSVSQDEILLLSAIDGISVAVSCLLFPYLWRD